MIGTQLFKIYLQKKFKFILKKKTWKRKMFWMWSDNNEGINNNKNLKRNVKNKFKDNKSNNTMGMLQKKNKK